MGATPLVMPLVIENLREVAIASDQLPWQPLRSGVEICSLCQDADSGGHLALLRYQPGASVPRHHHPGYEQILVLAGEQGDERGTYPAGTLVVNPPGSQHQVTSPQGCVVLIFWQRPVVFAPMEELSLTSDC
jgi:anti-sigma factor ChrR (cupin superfamily)